MDVRSSKGTLTVMALDTASCVGVPVTTLYITATRFAATHALTIEPRTYVSAAAAKRTQVEALLLWYVVCR